MGYSPRGHKESDMTEQLNNTKIIDTYIDKGALLVALVVKNLSAM